MMKTIQHKEIIVMVLIVYFVFVFFFSQVILVSACSVSVHSQYLLAEYAPNHDNYVSIL